MHSPTQPLSPLSAALVGPIAPRAWRAMFTVLLLAVLVLALMPAVPRMPSLGWDKLNHVAAFTALAFAGRFAFPRLRQTNLRLAVALLLLGGAIELAQALTPNRMADGIDLLADGVGIAAGLAMAALLLRWVGRTSAAARTR